MSLLSEFPSIPTEDYTPELVSSGVPLLFNMLESTQVRADASLTSDLTQLQHEAKSDKLQFL